MSKQLLKAMIMAQPHLVTASGSLIRLDRAEFADAQRCEVSFAPVQSGSGDPSPSNVRPISGWTGVNVTRTGANLFAAQQIAITDTNWWSSLINNSGMFTSASTDTKTRLQLTIDAYNDSTLLGTIGQRDYCPKGMITFAVDSSTYPTMNRVRIKHNGSSKDLGAVFAWNIPTGEYILSLDVVNNDVQTVGGFVIRNLMVSTATTQYAPYNGVTVPVNWNLINDTLRKITGTTIYIGNTTDGYRIWLTTGVYTFSAQMLNGADYGAYIRGQTASGATVIWTAGTHTTSGTVTITKDDYYRINFYAEGIIAANIGACQLERGAIATPYTPYVGTVYGGSVDLTSGTLTVTHGMFTIDSVNWYNEGSNTSRQMWSMIGNDLPDVKPAQSQNNLPNAISTIFKPEIGSSTTTYSPYMISFLRLYPKRLTITFEPNQYANVDEMKAAMAGVPIVYELETPLTYQLTPTDIKLLRGENNIFSNSNGNIILTYWTH